MGNNHFEMKKFITSFDSFMQMSDEKKKQFILNNDFDSWFFQAYDLWKTTKKVPIEITDDERFCMVTKILLEAIKEIGIK